MVKAARRADEEERFAALADEIGQFLLAFFLKPVMDCRAVALRFFEGRGLAFHLGKNVELCPESKFKRGHGVTALSVQRSPASCGLRM